MAWPNIDATKPAGTDKKKFGDDEIRAAKQHTIDCMGQISNFTNLGSTPALKTAVWTTATRPSGANLADRVTGFNTDLGYEEYYDAGATSWRRKGANPAGLVPVGGCIPYGGMLGGTGNKYPVEGGVVNNNWHICDGTDGTIDLRDKFVLAAGTSHAAGTTGGEETHVLTATEIPAHTHPSVAGGGAGFGGTLGSSSNSPYSFPWNTSLGYPALNTDVNSGGGGAHNNMPPYYAMVYIQRIA